MLSAIFSGMHRHTRPAAYADKRMQQHHTGSYRPGSQGFSFTGEFPDELTGQPVDVSGQRRRYAASAGMTGSYQAVGAMDTMHLPVVNRFGMKLIPAIALLTVLAMVMACAVVLAQAENTRIAKQIAAQETELEALSAQASDTLNEIAVQSNDANIRQAARRLGMINARSITVEYLDVPEEAVFGPGTVNSTQDLAAIW